MTSIFRIHLQRRAKTFLAGTVLFLLSLSTPSRSLRNSLWAQPAAGGVEATWGLKVISAIVNDKQNVVLPILDCQLVGFEEDLLTEYRAHNVRRIAADARIIATVPVAGVFYPGFIFYDSEGAERIGVFIDGEPRGVAVADTDDNRQYLFFLTTPQTFKGGEKIELRALGSEGIYRTEDLVLLKQRPAPGKHVYVISDVLAQPRVEGGKAAATLTWITNWPSVGVVEWDGGKLAEDSAESNHRVILENLSPNQTYRFRITARSREGKAIASEWQSFSTQPVAVTGQVKRATVPLSVEASTAGFPVTSGVPFPKGALGADHWVRVVDSNGIERPLQTETLARWDDGSVKWVLLDFQANGGPAYSLEYGSEIRRKPVTSALSVVDSKDAVTVVTGPLKFIINKQRFGFIDSLWLDKNGDGTFDESERIITPERPGALYLMGPDGLVYTSLTAPEQVAVEESGPLRAVIRVTGEHRSVDGRKMFAYCFRFHAYAGQSFIRVQHTLGNSNGESEFTTIKSLSLRLPLVASGFLPRRWALGENYAGVFHGTQPLHLQQHTDDHYNIDADGPRHAAEGRRAPNWAEWSDGARTVTLAVRDFWQNYPKDLLLSSAGIELALCPLLKPDEYETAKDTVDDHRLYYYLQAGNYKLRQGVTKTHDIWLDFEPGRARPSVLRTRQAPLLAVAPATWYSSSNAFGELPVPKPTGLLATYDAFFARTFQGFLENRETNREYGMLNFGDWWGERVINWGNSEYDTQHAFLMQFARTGDLRYFRAAEEMEWHNRDVDTVHYHSDKSRVGGVYTHCVGHTGDYYAQSPVPGQGIITGGFKVSHTFIEGHLDYYFFAGDRRSLDTARMIADFYDGPFLNNFDFTNCRNPGWHLILTEAMYNATNERYYLNAAKIIVERVLERQTSNGGWKRFLTDDHCNCLPRHMGNAGFMVGILMTGLKQYYQITGDERAADSVVKAANYLIDDLWTPKISGFRYTSCPRTTAGVGSNFLLFDGIAFAQQRTQDARLREVLLAGTEAAVKNLPSMGKSFTQYTRVTPHFVGYLAELQESASVRSAVQSRR